MSLVFKTALLFRKKKNKQKTFPHPFLGRPTANHGVAPGGTLQREPQLFIVAVVVGILELVRLVHTAAEVLAGLGWQAGVHVSVRTTHSEDRTDRTVFAKSAEAFNILCIDYVSVCVPTWRMLFPAEESKTHYPLWNAQTVTGCWLLAGGRQLQHPPTFQTSRTDKTRRTS